MWIENKTNNFENNEKVSDNTKEADLKTLNNLKEKYFSEDKNDKLSYIKKIIQNEKTDKETLSNIHEWLEKIKADLNNIKNDWKEKLSSFYKNIRNSLENSEKNDYNPDEQLESELKSV